MKQEILLSRLLDKYEGSKHLSQPGTSRRRVMLRIEKNEFPEYVYEDAQIRDDWNNIVRDLEERSIVSTQWVAGRPVLSCVALSLDHLAECYELTGRKHPKELADTVARMVTTRLSLVATNWILAWRDDVACQAQKTLRVPPYCKKDLSLLDKLLKAFGMYDSLHGEPMTMRAFSNKCYQNTKTFEKEVRDQFLKIASIYNAELKEACEQSEMGERERLAYLGIYVRPELYELSGHCTIQTINGNICIDAASPYGLALPSSGIDAIRSFDLTGVKRIVFVENKTNYDEFILSELKPQEIAVYHGGYLSPQKRKFFQKIAEAIHDQIDVVFWADIDLGGFRMFEQLQTIFPSLLPMRMSSEDVINHYVTGLKRSENYLNEVQTALDTEINAGMPKKPQKMSLLASGVRIMRIRSNQEVPDYYTGRSEKSTEERLQFTSSSGIFQYDDVFWGIHGKPNDPQYTKSFQASRIDHPKQRLIRYNKFRKLKSR